MPQQHVRKKQFSYNHTSLVEYTPGGGGTPINFGCACVAKVESGVKRVKITLVIEDKE